MLVATAGTSVGASLLAVSSSDTDLRLTLANDKIATSNGVYLSLIGRQISSSVLYNARLRLSTSGAFLMLAGQNGATAFTVKSEVRILGLAPTAGVPVKIRLQVTGTAPTTLRVKAWSSSGTEPAAWQLTGTDSTSALQLPGAIGLTSYLSGSSTVTSITTKMSQLSAEPVGG